MGTPQRARRKKFSLSANRHKLFWFCVLLVKVILHLLKDCSRVEKNTHVKCGLKLKFMVKPFNVSLTMFTCLAPRTIHLPSQLVSFLQTVIWTTNHSSAIRTCGSVYGATALTNDIGVSIGTFKPMTGFEVHGCYDLSFFLRCQRRESWVGAPKIKRSSTSSTSMRQPHVSRDTENNLENSGVKQIGHVFWEVQRSRKNDEFYKKICAPENQLNWQSGS